MLGTTKTEQSVNIARMTSTGDANNTSTPWARQFQQCIAKLTTTETDCEYWSSPPKCLQVFRDPITHAQFIAMDVSILRAMLYTTQIAPPGVALTP